jgi:hypothetical protein
MRARQLIDGASYGPEALKAMGQAFDEAWRSIEGNFGGDAIDTERARMRLAEACSVATPSTLNERACDWLRRCCP